MLACSCRITTGAARLSSFQPLIPQSLQSVKFRLQTRFFIGQRQGVILQYTRQQESLSVRAMDNSGLFHSEDGEDLMMSPCASDGGKFQHLVANKRGDSCQTLEVMIALAMTVVLGVGNRVLYKLALVPLKAVPLLSRSACHIRAFFICRLLSFLSKLWGIPFCQWPSCLIDGAACFLNTSALSTCCHGAPLLPLLFIGVNMCFNISLLHLLKISSAVVSTLASTISESWFYNSNLVAWNTNPGGIIIDFLNQFVDWT